MRLALGIIGLIFLSASPLKNQSFRHLLVVWNTGQGQWVSVINPNDCLHFDVGGEIFPWKKLADLCGKKENKLFLSHWDWDHIGALAKWPPWPTCLALSPIGTSSPRKMNLLKKFKLCQESDVPHWTPALSKDSNSESHVVSYERFLIPGDSPKTQERIWKNQSWVSQSQVLILGHHGSRTSTSNELLERLPHLRMAIASARWRKYHHPHPETVALLNQHHIPVISTEDWGSIWFEL